MEHILCAGPRCWAELDVDTCCDRAGNCSAYECPKGHMLKENASEIFCSAPQCVEADGACCERRGCCYAFLLEVEDGSPVHEGKPCCFSRSKGVSLAHCQARRALSPMDAFVGFTSDDLCPTSVEEAALQIRGGMAQEEPQSWCAQWWPWVSFVLSLVLAATSALLLASWWFFRHEPRHAGVWCYRRIDEPAPPHMSCEEQEPLRGREASQTGAASSTLPSTV